MISALRSQRSQRQVDLCELEVSLVYISSSRTAKDKMKRNLVSKKKKVK